MDDTNILNKISWIVEYSGAAKWFNNLNQEIVFSPSIRLFVISIQHLKGFNKSGTKVIIKYAYYDYKMEITRMAIMGYWQPKIGLKKIIPFSRCCYNLTGYPVKLGYVKGDESFATVEKIGNTFVFTGFIGEILKIIFTHLGIRIVKIEVEPNGTYGGLDQNNNPTGVFNLLATNQADIILNPLVYTMDRNKVADFTISIFETNIIGIYKPPNDDSKFWTFYVKPFSMYSWIIIVTIIPCLMMFSVILLRYFPNTGMRDSNQFDILVICGLLLNQGSSQYPTSVGWRIYHWSVMLLGTLLVAFYGSKIVAENAVLKHKELFTDFYEVAEHPIYRPIVWKDTAYHNMLKGLNKSGTKVFIKYAYSDYKMEIAKMAIMGYWQPKTGLRKIVPFSGCCYNLTGYPVKLGYVKGDKVYAIVEKIGNTFVLTEFMGDILNIILTHLGIRIVKIEVEPNGTYGGLDQNNEPTGLFKLLANNQADIIIHPMVYTIIRNKVADFTVSVFETKIIGLYKPPDDNSKFWTFYAKPFSMYSWIIIVTIIPCLMMFSVILLRYFPNTGVSDSNQFDILVICGLLLNQGSSQYPTSVGWRIYHWSVMLLGTVLVAFYGSKIVAENAVFKHKELFTDFYEVAEHPIYRPIVWKDTAYHNMLKDSSDPEASSLWNRMKKDINKHTVTSIEQIVEQVDCCQGVYIDSSTYIMYLKNQNPSFVILDRSLGNLQNGIALQKNSPLTKMFDTV
ncbi:Glutamate receptor ionotropic, delta-1 [Nymphon striatum]|nr:Glutamate receptor ionotropic, delta-1 [Nymphon striatum]